jgi:hypothetical protein
VIRHAIVAGTLVVGCGSDRAEVAKPPTAPAVWSEIQGGLRVRLEVPSPVTPAESVVTKVHVENTTAAPIRILHVRPEPFRLFTSSLRVWASGKVVSLQPDPHPHGYLLTEEDFIVIPPNAATSYDQTLYLSDALAQPGTFEVELMFENKTKQFPGGANTLDGVTKPLFEGKELADLWTGTLSVRTPMTVRR